MQFRPLRRNGRSSQGRRGSATTTTTTAAAATTTRGRGGRSAGKKEAEREEDHYDTLPAVSVECTISAGAGIRFRVNGTVTTPAAYKALLRSTLGFENPCFFIQQARATALAAERPTVLWGYLQVR